MLTKAEINAVNDAIDDAMKNGEWWLYNFLLAEFAAYNRNQRLLQDGCDLAADLCDGRGWADE